MPPLDSVEAPQEVAANTGTPSGASSRKELNLSDLRGQLEGETGPEMWRSLDELAQTPEFEEMVHREFPQQATEWLKDTSRRRFLQLMSASVAFGGITACTRQPLEKIVPYVEQPEQIVPGKPLFFATGSEQDGYWTGLLAESHMGRPTKIEGNPEHPASLGATNLFAQASVLDLYDPDRAATVKNLGRIRTWEDFGAEIASVVEAQRALQGEGLRILSGTVTSPSFAAVMDEVLTELPQAQWVRYDPVGSTSERDSARRAFGEPVNLVYDFAKAKVVVALDADFLSDGPGSTRYAREFSRARRVRANDFETNRLYSIESATTSTGTLADHRVPLSAAEVGHFALALAAEIGVRGIETPAAFTSGRLHDHVKAAAKDLRAARGASIVLAGRQTDTELHQLCHAINSKLNNFGSTIATVEPIETRPAAPNELATLVADMSAGRVDTLLILGSNPVYDAPRDLGFEEAFQKVNRRIRLGLFEDETSELCHWNLPEAHYLESWGDGRAFDGTVTMCQPLIEPLYDGQTATEVLTLLTETGKRSGDDVMKAVWAGRLEGDFDRAFRKCLHDGLVPNTLAAPKPVELLPRSTRLAADTLAAKPAPSSQAIEVLFRADPTVYDGRYNNNGWLQECPKPLTKLTWDNAALVSPALATELGLVNEQVIDLSVDGQSLSTAIWIHPGQPKYSVTLHLGYGRTKTGRIGTGTGFATYSLRHSNHLWDRSGVTLTKTAGRYPLSSTQLHNNIELEGIEAGKRHLIRTATVGEFEAHPEFAKHVGHGIDESLSLYEGFEYPTYAWGLSVDLSSCTGCNSCVIACQSENNVPIVGKEQVGKGREMHWLRIDRYFQGDMDNPAAHSQPVMCMHCEQAPCEVVCPVAATVHSDEGLNDMIYNRCVGTRYCSNNCPYKVRRFNFLKWNDTDTEVLDLQRNPDVTVRVRGVMEKCSYCVQRINSARITAKKDRRSIRDGEVVTACQQACPSESIIFGDLNDPESRVSKRKQQPLDYGILTELGTRPRTTYLAKINNPSELLVSKNGNGHGAGGGHGADSHGIDPGAEDAHSAESGHGGEA